MRARLPTLIFVAAAGVLAQEARRSGDQSRPTFRTGANYVRVDMYATLEGQPVEDLGVDEVSVTEDGVPQKIEVFEHVKVPRAPSQELRVEPTSVNESREMARDGRARVFVIFLDTYHTQIEGSANMRGPLVRFLDRLLGPDDLVALMTPEMAASDLALGRKTTVISNIMQEQWMWGRRARPIDQDPKEDLYDACYGDRPGSPAPEMKARRREKLTLDTLEDLLVHLGGLREERKAVLAVTEGWRLFRENRNLGAQSDRVRPALPPFGRRPAGERATSEPDGVSRIECETDLVALASLDNGERLRRIADDANRANVTFYPVYARGLVPFDAPIGPERPPSLQADAANLSARHDSLRFLADNTDGTSVINTNNIEGALRRIVDDLSSYYLFGYHSSNTRLDGRFRNIGVRVTRPGVRVRARRGYRGLSPEELLGSAARSAPSGEAATMSKALNAVVGVNARSSFRVRASSWAGEATPGVPEGSFWIVGELDFRTRKELAWTAGVQAQVVVAAADGKRVEERTVEIPAGEGTFGLRVPETGSLAPGDYAVRVRLRPGSDDDLALSDTARVTIPSASAMLGEAVLWRRGPSTGPRFVQTADPRFQRTERIRLELATSAAGDASARVLDRAGKGLQVPVALSERADPSGQFRWIVADASLAPLAVGDYAVEVTLADAKQVTAFRIVP
jgi:VWFA-related protein